MKKALIGAGAIAAMVMLGIVLLSGQKSAESAVVTADIIVDGMSCQNCADKIDAALSELEGVKEVDVRLEQGTASVKYDPALVTMPAVEASITKLGYAIGKAGAASTKDKADGCEDGAADGCCASKKPGAKT
jgi:copper ion binding protein